MIIVDSQVHVWEADSPEHPWAKGMRPPQRPEPLTPQGLLREMDEAGVARAVLVPPSWVGDYNGTVIEAAKAHPARFAAMGRFPAGHPDRAGLVAQWKAQGMIGLLIVCMIGATTAATDVALNKNAGMFVRNFYRPILRPAASDFEQVVVGKIATVVFGVTITTIALLVVTRSKVSLFDAYLYLGAYLGVPLSVPLFMGMLLRRVPRWAGWGTALFGMLVTTFIYVFLPSEMGRAWCEPWLGSFAYGYAVANKFVMTSLVTAPLTTLFFWGTRVFYREPTDARAAGEVREFFRRLDTPVDFEREVGQDNSALQARLIGRLACTYGGFVALMVFVPNPLIGRLSILACSLVPLGVGTGLLRYARRQDARKAAATPACLPVVQNAG